MHSNTVSQNYMASSFETHQRPPASLIGAPLNTLNNSVLQLWNCNVSVQQFIAKVDTKLIESVVNHDHMHIRG